MMHINRIMDLIGLGDDKPEDLHAAMEQQILPEVHHGKGKNAKRTGDQAGETTAGNPTEEMIAQEEPVRLANVGRCPTCGDKIIERAEQPCAWCDTPCRPEQDGFHLVHIALGSFQERHCFCSDDCFEAFRRMYPARVHRDCYERSCSECNYCIKRYIDESDGLAGLEQEPGPSPAIKPGKD